MRRVALAVAVVATTVLAVISLDYGLNGSAALVAVGVSGEEEITYGTFFRQFGGFALTSWVVWGLLKIAGRR